MIQRRRMLRDQYEREIKFKYDRQKKERQSDQVYAKL